MRTSQGKRACYALAITIFVCSIAPVSQVLAETLPIRDKDTQVIAHTLLTESVSIGDILRFGSDTAGNRGEPSEAFLSEVCDPHAQGYCDVVANDDSSVVGFSNSGPVLETLDGVLNTLEKNGWRMDTRNSSQEDTASALATCTKESGTINWACISCAQVNGLTSVIVQTHSSS